MSFSLPENVDETHIYVYRSGVDGVYSYFYVDPTSNFWEYTNAPADSPDYDPFGGEAILVRDQPLPGTSPGFFSPEGRKLSVAVPEDAHTLPNELYNPTDPANIWYGVYIDRNGGRRYVYYDTDVRKNFDLWAQYQLRVADAGIPSYRAYAKKLFNSEVPKDRVIGTLLMLVDQGMYPLQDLIFAAVKDLEFIDTTVKLLGRKFVCDPDLLDFLTSLVVERDIEAPLFFVDTFKGPAPLGMRHASSIFAGLKINPTFLHYWHCNHTFSRIVHRLSLQAVPIELVMDMAYNELARVFATSDDVRVTIDAKVRDTLLKNYAVKSESMQQMAETTQLESNPDNVAKSLTSINTDDYGVLMVWSDLDKRKSDETQFSIFLHAEPMHEATPQEEALVAQTAESAQQAQEEDGEKPIEETTENADI